MNQKQFRQENNLFLPEFLDVLEHQYHKCRKTDLKKARKASQLVNVNSKELLYFKRAHFQWIFSFGFTS